MPPKLEKEAQESTMELPDHGGPDDQQTLEDVVSSSSSSSSLNNSFQFLSVINQLKRESNVAGNKLAAVLEHNKTLLEEKKREEKEQRRLFAEIEWLRGEMKSLEAQLLKLSQSIIILESKKFSLSLSKPIAALQESTAAEWMSLLTGCGLETERCNQGFQSEYERLQELCAFHEKQARELDTANRNVSAAKREIEDSQCRLAVWQEEIQGLRASYQEHQQREKRLMEEIHKLDNDIVTTEEERLELEAIGSALRKKNDRADSRRGGGGGGQGLGGGGGRGD